MTRPGLTTLLALVLVSCGASRRQLATSSDAHAAQANVAEPLTTEAGRWLAWSGEGRTWGTFVTARGAGPTWPLDVVSGGSWSTDGRWLTSCAQGFVAARWMGSVRPSRIGLLNGGCSSLIWAPQGDTALAITRGSKRARLLSFTPGEQPSLHEVPFEIAVGASERLHDMERLTWAPSGESFLVRVDGAYQRWVDAAKSPGQVRKLVTADGLEAILCAWSPSGRRLGCMVTAASSEKDGRDGPRRALAVFEIREGEISSRPLFESPGYYALEMSFVDDERLVVKDRDATRLHHVSGSEPPITLSANASDFAVSPGAPRVAYLSRRGLCLREAGPQLGPEQLLIPGPLTGVGWSSNGRHLLAHRADLRAVSVVTDAGTDAQRVRTTPEVGAASALKGEFSVGGTLLLGQAFERTPRGALRASEWKPLQVWSLKDWSQPRLVPPPLNDKWAVLSPDDSALVARPEALPGMLQLGPSGGVATAFHPLGRVEQGSSISWQPGKTAPLDGGTLPAARPSANPRHDRVALPPEHPITLATAYVRGSKECSGALIDPWLVVTAHHCVDGPGPVQVVLGRHSSWQKAYSVAPFRVIHHPNVRHVEALDLFENDLALIELPEAAPPQAKPFVLAREDEAALGSEVYLAGYGGDWLVGLSAQPELRYGISQLVAPSAGISGTIAWRSAQGAENGGCFGDSGGPALVMRSDGGFAIVGIHYGSGGTDYTQACRNTGVAGKLVSERAWLNEAADKLTLSRRGSGPPRARANPF